VCCVCTCGRMPHDRGSLGGPHWQAAGGGAYMTAQVAAVWAVAAARCGRFASGAKDFKRGAFGEAEGEFGGINSVGGKERYFKENGNAHSEARIREVPRPDFSIGSTGRPRGRAWEGMVRCRVWGHRQRREGGSCRVPLPSGGRSREPVEHNRRILDANHHTITQRGNEQAAARLGGDTPQAPACRTRGERTVGPACGKRRWVGSGGGWAQRLCVYNPSGRGGIAYCP
jgi:hypothetical protein